MLALTAAFAALALIACGGGPKPQTSATPTAVIDIARIGKPQAHADVGDVQVAFARYANALPDLVAEFQAQPWFKDGLTRDESLFTERSLTFVASYNGPRTAVIGQQTIEQKLYRYQRVRVKDGEVELLVNFEPGQDGDRELSTMAAVIPVLESLVGTQFPDPVITVVNGSYAINDFNDGQFIRIDRSSVTSTFTLAHELAHSYWSMAPEWFNEGMADIYAVMAMSDLNAESPPGWRPEQANIDSYYQSRKAQVDSGKLPNMILPQRMMSSGLYEVADVFLLDIRNVIGDDSFRAAAKDIYDASDFGRINLKDKRIEDVFLQHASGAQANQVMQLFNKNIWGDSGERYQQLQELDSSP